MKSVIVALLPIALVCLSGFGLSGCQVIEDGQRGVSKSFGEISEDSLVPGLYFILPMAREIEIWNVKTKKLSRRLNIPSVEGLIVNLDATLLYRTEDVVGIRKTIGMDYRDKVVASLLNDAFREKLGNERVEDIYRKQARLTAEIRQGLTNSFKARGIIVENLLVTDLTLPQTFREAIEKKLEQEQKALQKEFELVQAQKDAEIEIAIAEGAAKAQEIVRRTLSPEYLQYLWIKTLNENPNVIYVATESNLPIFKQVSSGEVSK